MAPAAVGPRISERQVAPRAVGERFAGGGTIRPDADQHRFFRRLKSAPSGRGAQGPGVISWPDVGQPVVGAPASAGKNDVAVIVAIEDYAELSDIPGARQNGEDWYRYLTGTRGIPASRVQYLVDKDARDYAIEDAAKSASQQVKTGGKLWFISIGHGAPSETQQGLLVAYDAEQSVQGLLRRSVNRKSSFKP